eukprot:UN17271
MPKRDPSANRFFSEDIDLLTDLQPEITLPGKLFVVPQVLYFPPDGNLKNQITYPDPAENISDR